MIGVLILAYTAVGIVVIDFTANLRGLALPAFPFRLADLYVAAAIAIVAHELGHRLVGAALHWRCIRFGCGPVEVVRTAEGWRIRRVPMLWAAFITQVPPNFVHFRKQKCMTLLGGPLGSVTSAGLWWVLALHSHSSFAFALLSRMALLSALGVFELIPRRLKASQSDGYSLLQVIRNTEFVDQMRREMLAEASNHTRLRYRDWPADLVERSTTGSDPYCLYLAYLHAMDGGCVDGAGSYMRRFLEKLPAEELCCYYAYEIAYWQAAFGHDAEEARLRIEAVPVDQEPLMRRRVEAAIALASGRLEEAELAAKETLAQYEKLPDSGSAYFEKDQLQFVLERASASIAVAR